MKRKTHGGIPARVPTKGIALARYSHSRVVLSFFFFKSMSNRQTARHGSSRFFRNAFQRDSRLSRVVCSGQTAERRSREAWGTRCTTGRQGRFAVARYPSGHIMHRGLPKGNLADAVERENRCFVRLYRRTRETGSYIYRTYTVRAG